MPHLTEAEDAYVTAHLDRRVRVTPKFDWMGDKGVFTGAVVGWHWYDGVVLHVAPEASVYTVNALPEHVMAFEFDRIEVLDAPCDHPRCDGETHYTGQRDRETNEDLEEGPCPDA